MFRGNTVEYDVSKIAMIFLGLHLDSFQGMFLQQPLLWLALLGIVPFAFANGRAAALVGLGKVDPLRELQLGEVT
ncbi:MAG: hypothetical protein HY741_06840 [Chloroflexi bacterium]|nr:hypothetical protein [Chloroflexota bacterium]